MPPAFFAARGGSPSSQARVLEKTQWTLGAGGLRSPDMDKKNDGTTTILNWALAVAVVATGILAMNNIFKTKELRELQSKILIFQNKQASLNNLIAEVMQYSQHNPSIDPILESIGAKPAKNATAPAAKPAGK
jgi:hypothetical protein